MRCNNAKGDRTPEEMGWTLPFRPAAPRGASWAVRGAEQPDPRWDSFLAAAA